MENTCTAKSSQVDAELTRLEKEIGSLESVISNLEKRLEPVLMPADPQAESEGSGSDKPVQVPLAARLDKAHHHLQRLRERLGTIVARIEL